MHNLRQFLHENPDTTLWERLANASKPIVIYGMGDGAEKIMSVLEAKGIACRDIFASDGFVRGHSFRGMRVKTLGEIEALYGDFIILLSFASRRPEVMSMLYGLSEKYELYAPDVNVSGDYGVVFDRDYFTVHREELFEASQLIHEDSRELFFRIIDFKLSGKLDYLRQMDELALPAHNMFRADMICNYADLGAYTGDTLRRAKQIYPNLRRAVLFEPDEKNVKKLEKYTQTLDIHTEIYNSAAWSSECEMILHMGFGMNTTLTSSGSNLQKKRDKTVKTLAPDSVMQSVDLIKYDVEGSEHQALLGSAKTIASCRPVLIVSAYHNNDDLFDLPPLIKRLNKNYRLHMSRHPCIPAWETEIVAVDPKYER